jgi:preprotein translocase subunit YajC
MPRKKQEKKHQELVEALKRGDKVITIGGIKGEISKVKEETVMLKVSENTEIEMLKKAIAYKDGEQ